MHIHFKISKYFFPFLHKIIPPKTANFTAKSRQKVVNLNILPNSPGGKIVQKWVKMGKKMVKNG